MSLVGVRVIALFALFGLTMFAGLTPVVVFVLWQRRKDSSILGSSESDRKGQTKSSSSAKILQLLLVFGGGVLLATCFVHMIPEIRENYDAYMESKEHQHEHLEIEVSTLPSSEPESGNNSKHNDVYFHPVHSEDGEGHHHDHSKVPWVEICICIGLFLTYFIEESILLLIGRDPTNHHHHHHHNHQQRQTHLEAHHDYNLSHEGSVDYGSMVTMKVAKKGEINGASGYDNVTLDLRGDVLTSTSGPNANSLGPLYVKQTPIGKESTWTRFLRGLIIVIAFLAHSIFDGVAIGLQTTTYSIWTMFFAICLHKLVVVFAIGFELFEKTESLLLTSIHMTLFSAMSPLGIFLTIAIEQGLTEEGSLSLILLNAIATGAILYIVFLEILQADRCPEVNGLKQLIALVAGFTLMTCLTVWA